MILPHYKIIKSVWNRTGIGKYSLGGERLRTVQNKGPNCCPMTLEIQEKIITSYVIVYFFNILYTHSSCLQCYPYYFLYYSFMCVVLFLQSCFPILLYLSMHLCSAPYGYKNVACSARGRLHNPSH